MSTPVSLMLGFSFNTNLARNLEPFRNAVLYQDFDYGLIVDGPEGSGKSVFAQQIACFLDKDHHIDINKQICYHPAQFKKAVMTLQPGKAIVWDEARRGLNRRRSTQEVNLSITDLLAECRQHNLFLVIVMPSFYDMDMNVAVWRTRALIHVWYDIDPSNPERPLKRGFFRFYNEEGKKMLYTDRDLRRQYKYPHLHNMSFDATFPHHYVVDEKLYREKKREAEEFYRKSDGGESTVNEEALTKSFKKGIGYCYKILSKRNLLKPKAREGIAEELGISAATVYTWVPDEKLQGSIVESGPVDTYKLTGEKEEVSF